MGNKTDIPQHWKDWCDQQAKEAAGRVFGAYMILGIVEGTVSPRSGIPDTQRVKRIRYLLEAYKAERAHKHSE